MMPISFQNINLIIAQPITYLVAKQFPVSEVNNIE